MNEYPEIMTKEQLAEYLHLGGEQSVRAACRKGEIPFVKLMGSYKFFKKAIDEWLYQKSMESLQKFEEEEEEEVVVTGGSYDSY